MPTQSSVRGPREPAAPPTSSRRARGAGLLLVVLLVGLGACGDEHAAEAARAASEAGQALAAGDASRALHLATRGLDRTGERAELLVVAAAACNRLDRHGDAAAYALRGLDVVGDDDELAGDLTFERGRAALGVFQELGRGTDWSEADALLADATRAGRHRAEAASLVVALQFLGGRSNVERARQYARVAAELDPGGRYDLAVTRIFATQGLER